MVSKWSLQIIMCFSLESPPPFIYDINVIS